MHQFWLKTLFVFFSFFLIFVFGQNISSNSTTDVGSKTSLTETSSLSSTTSSHNSLNDSCEAFSTCETCLGHKDATCYFCKASNKCFSYSVKDLIPTDKCNVRSVYYSTCTVSFLVIACLSGAAVGLVLIGLIICCCCCCCKNGKMKLSKADLKWARQREERKAKSEEKRKERAERTLEIRRKYGLLLDASERTIQR